MGSCWLVNLQPTLCRFVCHSIYMEIRQLLQNWLLPSFFMCVPGFELKSPGLCSQPLYSLSHLAIHPIIMYLRPVLRCPVFVLGYGNLACHSQESDCHFTMIWPLGRFYDSMREVVRKQAFFLFIFS